MSNRPLHQDPIPFITLPNWIRAAQLCGFSIQPIFGQLGIETDLLNLESSTIERGKLERVMEACVAQSRGQHFPFVLGETFAFEYLPDIETFLTTSASLREAVQVFTWVRELINPMLDVRLEEQDDSARLVLEFAGLEASTIPRPWFSESLFAAILKFARMLKKDDGWMLRLNFRHPAPAHAAIYESFFRLPIAFDAARYSLEFDRRLLDLPLDGDFPALHSQARQRVEQRLQRLPRRGGLVAAIERTIARKPALLAQGVEAIAMELALHPRTLQRRLRDEGESYAELSDRLRYRLALDDLANPALAIEDISERLGFSDRRSFTRAFTRWSGVSPAEFRSKSR